jgi:hypothetical protein
MNRKWIIDIFNRREQKRIQNNIARKSSENEAWKNTKTGTNVYTKRKK